MADLIIKPQNTSGDKIIIQDQAGQAVLTTADSGVEINNATNITVSGDIIPSTPLSHRNMIINGAMNVYQRGSLAITQTNNGGFALDRFKYNQNSAMGQWQGTMSQHAMSDAEVVSTGHINALKIVTTTVENAIGSDEYGYLYYTIEAQDCQRLCYGRSNAKSATLSFWAKSKVAGNYAVALYQSDGNDNIGSVYTLAADTWTKVEITFAGNTLANIVNDTGAGLQFQWGLIIKSDGDYVGTDNTSWASYTAARFMHGHTAVWGTSTSHDFYLTGVQFELGSSATPFEHRSYADELQRCKRYYQYVGDDTYQYFMGGIGNGSSQAITSITTDPVMRTLPSVSQREGSSNYFAAFMDSDSNSVISPSLPVVYCESGYITNHIYTVWSTTGGSDNRVACVSCRNVALTAEL